MYLVFDTETTGLPNNWKAPASDINNWPKITQLAYIVYDEKQNEMLRNSLLVQVGEPLSETVKEITRLDDSMLKRYGVTQLDAFLTFASALSRCDYAVAHNMQFNQKVVEATAHRLDVPIPFSGVETLCTKDLSTDYCKIPVRFAGSYKWPTLQELHKHLFGEFFEDAHRADIDTEACAKCFFQLLERGVITLPDKPAVSETPKASA
jgi:DNA polymerase III alpha subunit (gram-positive type)